MTLRRRWHSNMKKVFFLLVTLSALVGGLAGCGATPAPTEPPATQTPWIVVVTATPKPEGVVEVQPTQTPWIIVATPTPALEEAATAGPELSPTASAQPAETGAVPTLAPPTPSNTPDAADLIYPPPALLDPPDGRPVSWKSTVLLKWSSVGDLAEDEYYHLHLERRPTTEGQEWYGDYVYTKEPEYWAEADFLAPFHTPEEAGKATVYWWVRVVRKTGEDENGKPTGVDIGAPSEERTLILDPKPEGE
jgi:hypothetical protein